MSMRKGVAAHGNTLPASTNGACRRAGRRSIGPPASPSLGQGWPPRLRLGPAFTWQWLQLWPRFTSRVPVLPRCRGGNGVAGVRLAATAVQHADGFVMRGLQKDASRWMKCRQKWFRADLRLSSQADLGPRPCEVLCCEPILLLVVKAGDRTRTGDVQLGKLPCQSTRAFAWQ